MELFELNWNEQHECIINRPLDEKNNIFWLEDLKHSFTKFFIAKNRYFRNRLQHDFKIQRNIPKYLSEDSFNHSSRAVIITCYLN